MSFVNQVLALEGERQGGEYLSLGAAHEVEFPDNGNEKNSLRYFVNPLYLIPVIIIACFFLLQIRFDSTLPEAITDEAYIVPLEQRIINSRVEPVKILAPERTVRPVSFADSSKVVLDETLIVDATVAAVDVNEQQKIIESKVELIVQEEEQIYVEPVETFENDPFEMAHFEILPTEIDFSEKTFKQAQADIKFGNKEKAILSLRELLATDERHLSARILLTHQLLEQGQVKEAEDLLQRGWLLFPQNSQIARPLAHLLVDTGRTEQGLFILKKGQPLVSRDPEYHSFIAALEQQRGDHNAAIKTYKKILSIQANNGKWWLGLALSSLAAGHHKEALSAFESGLNDPDLPSSLTQFAKLRIHELNSLVNNS